MGLVNTGTSIGAATTSITGSEAQVMILTINIVKSPALLF